MNEELEQSLARFIRVGEVVSIDTQTHTARVAFKEDNNNVSYNLAVLERNTYDNHDHQMPDVGEDVLCVFLPCGSEDGFILGSFYAGEVTPPSTNPDERRVVFKDEAFAVHNRKEHTFDFQTENTKIHVDRERVTVETPLNITLRSHGTIDIKADGVITIKGSAVNIN